MNATLPAPELRTLAPVFAARFALIIAGLTALIARALLRDPEFAPLIVPLWSRLNRAARGITTIMAGLVTGRRAAQRSGIDGGRGAARAPLAPRERSRAPKPPIPATHAWLVRTLKHEAAAYASQLSHLLNEPGVDELLAAAPTACRLLRPLCRMLGIPGAARSAVAGDPAAGTQLCVPKAAGRAPSRPESPAALPDAQRSGAASIAAGARFRPESAVTPSRIASPTPPLCPRLRRRWPWFPGPQAKPA